MARAGTNAVILLTMALAICLFSSAVAAKQGKWFDRIYIIVFDKVDFEKASKNEHFAKWADQGRRLDHYYSVGKGSQSNYISMIAGQTFNIKDDGSWNLKNRTLIDRLQPYDVPPVVSWRAYLEDYTGDCDARDKIGPGYCGLSDNGTSYVRAHNPFISFNGIRSTSERCANIVPAAQLATDASQNAVPEVNFYVPNKCHNGEGHKGVVSAGEHLDNLLKQTIVGHAVSNRTLVVVTFASSRNGKPRAQVFTALIPLGQMRTIPRGTRDNENTFDHYSLLRTVEDNWDLRHLGAKDADAKNFFRNQNSASMWAPSFDVSLE